MPFTPQPKVPGDLIRSTDWNEAMTEILRLEVSKLNLTGGTISGPLLVGSNIASGSQIPALRVLHNGNFAWGNSLSIDQTVPGNNDGPKIRFQKTMQGVALPKSWSAGIINGPTQGHFVVNEDTGTGFGANRLTIAPGGNVGIGTSNPQEQFQIGDRWTFHSGGARVIGMNTRWDGANDVRIVNGWAAQIRMNNDGSLIFRNIPSGNAGTVATGNDIFMSDGQIRFGGVTNRGIFGEARSGQQAVVVNGHWDQLEIKGRVLDWTGSNLHIGYQNDHLTDSVIFGNGRLGKVVIPNPTTLDFGSSVRQMLNLWGTQYGIGVQSGTLYFRSNDHFAWHRRGTHIDTGLEPGTGGARLMSLETQGRLTVQGDIRSRGVDFVLSGRTNPTGAPGSSLCRAVVDWGNKLILNYAADFPQGTLVNSILEVSGQAFKPGGGSWANLSDKKLKKNIKPLKGSFEKILKLRGVTFDGKGPENPGFLPGNQTGMIAQEVEGIFPEWVGEHADGTKYIAVTGFEAHMIECIKTLHEEIVTLKTQLSKK